MQMPVRLLLLPRALKKNSVKSNVRIRFFARGPNALPWQRRIHAGFNSDLVPNILGLNAFKLSHNLKRYGADKYL